MNDDEPNESSQMRQPTDMGNRDHRAHRGTESTEKFASLCSLCLCCSVLDPYAITVRFAKPETVSHAAPGNRCTSSRMSRIAARNQSMSSFVTVIGGRNLITSV